MASQPIDTSGIERIESGLRSLADVDYTPLMMEWRALLEDDNRAGVLAGLDGWGDPMTPVTYRPTDPGKRRKPVDHSYLANNNLTSSWYRELDGPPLAPRREESRTITNFMTAHQRDGDDWLVIGAWADVMSIADVPFLGFHFRGEGALPVRNLAHVRPTALQRAKELLREFVSRYLHRDS